MVFVNYKWQLLLKKFDIKSYVLRQCLMLRFKKLFNCIRWILVLDTFHPQLKAN